MKTAFLHYWLVNMRGGENVLAEFCKLYPDADIYTHAYNHDKMEPPITEHTVYETFIGKLPGARINCQKYLPQFFQGHRELYPHFSYRQQRKAAL